MTMFVFPMDLQFEWACSTQHQMVLPEDWGWAPQKPHPPTHLAVLLAVGSNTYTGPPQVAWAFLQDGGYIARASNETDTHR